MCTSRSFPSQNLATLKIPPSLSPCLPRSEANPSSKQLSSSIPAIKLQTLGFQLEGWDCNLPPSLATTKIESLPALIEFRDQSSHSQTTSSAPLLVSPSHREDGRAQPRTLWTKVRALSLLMVRLIKRGHRHEEGDEAYDSTLKSQIPQDVNSNSPAHDEDAFFNGQWDAGPGPSSRAVQIDRSMVVGPRSHQNDGGGAAGPPPSDMELMKDRFAKLLLGEDMSGGGKGVSSALALSNAITNLAASVFAEQSRLEPMSAERKARWRREMNWLLSVADYIVEFVPSRQTSKDGVTMEIMITQQRKDLQLNIPTLCKLDTMLIGTLDDFEDQKMFWYVSRDAAESEKGNAQRKDDKWWLPTVRVPPHGLSEDSSRWLQFQKDSATQVLKVAMAINAQVLMEMEVPDAYIESLPKNGRSSLGDAIYKSITTDDVFDPEEFLETLDLSTEHKIVDLKDRIEASVVIWRKKMHDKEAKSSWSSTISLEKREQFEERAETILILIKQRFPGIPQSALDISKIQYNNDVGLAILESYSRVLESLAHLVISRIDDVFYADSLAKGPTTKSSNARQSFSNVAPANKPDNREELVTLSDFMSWPSESEPAEDMRSTGDVVKKPPEVKTKKFLYIDKVRHLGGLRSPTARH
ncbi:hypothetical protein ZIOFF_040689 [Zingiber officinale]|uniref:PRONE domain-containing protein n=2 Tax=Zingiber officinale TaxID=94328 RepID=A0A8J5L175_ZINOF|nr:hypothetical protein ZIOFF_040689 [Zingiber officinale]